MHRNLRSSVAHVVAALSLLATAPIAVHAGETFTMSVRAVHKNEKFELLATNPLGEKVQASPAVWQDHLLIRGEKHLFCIGK